MFIQRADNKYNEPWRWIIGFIAIFLGCQLFGGIPFLIAVIFEEIAVNGNVNGMMNADESYLMNVLSHNTYIIMFWYVGTGFLLGLFTLMDEGTELAIGFHAANNLFIAILVTADWTAFQTDSLLLDVSDPEVGFMTFVPLLIYYPALVLFFAWRYKWKNWNDKLFGKIVKQQDEERFKSEFL